MKKIETEIVINKKIDKVWNTLIDFENHQYWNPVITDIHGASSSGEKIIITIKTTDKNALTLKSKIIISEKNKELRWIAHIGNKYLFEGEHYFILENVGDNKTKLIHGEVFRGLLIVFLRKALLATTKAYIQMNEAMKKECEK